MQHKIKKFKKYPHVNKKCLILINSVISGGQFNNQL